MIRELDKVVLVRDLVEFVTGGGGTIAVVTLSESDIRPMQGKEILHVRTLMTGY